MNYLGELSDPEIVLDCSGVGLPVVGGLWNHQDWKTVHLWVSDEIQRLTQVSLVLGNIYTNGQNEYTTLFEGSLGLQLSSDLSIDLVGLTSDHYPFTW